MATRSAAGAWLAVVLMALVAAPALCQSAGWLKGSIEGVQHETFTETHVLYRFYTATPGAYAYSFTPSTGGESSVLVKWNRDAAGWELLSLEYNRTMFASDADSLEGYFAAGYAEGFLTFDDIYSQYVNQMLHLQQDLEENANATAFMVQNFANMKAYPTNTPFGFQVARIMKQLSGLAAGWNAYYALHKDAFKNISAPLDEEMLYRLNFESGLQTVLDKFSNHSRTGMAWQSARCSALVKVLDRELYFGPVVSLQHHAPRTFIQTQRKTHFCGNVVLTRAPQFVFLYSCFPGRP
jgi:hypothetical protein